MVAKDVKLNTARIGNAEKRTDGLESEVEKLKAENENMKKEFEALKGLVGQTQEKVNESSGDKILEEMAERGSRETMLSAIAAQSLHLVFLRMLRAWTWREHRVYLITLAWHSENRMSSLD